MTSTCRGTRLGGAPRGGYREGGEAARDTRLGLWHIRAPHAARISTSTRLAAAVQGVDVGLVGRCQRHAPPRLEITGQQSADSPGVCPPHAACAARSRTPYRRLRRVGRRRRSAHRARSLGNVQLVVDASPVPQIIIIREYYPRAGRFAQKPFLTATLVVTKLAPPARWKQLQRQHAPRSSWSAADANARGC